MILDKLHAVAAYHSMHGPSDAYHLLFPWEVEELRVELAKTPMVDYTGKTELPAQFCRMPGLIGVFGGVLLFKNPYFPRGSDEKMQG